MFAVAWIIERLVLRHLVNQEGATLLMATLGISYFLDGLGQALFGSDIYKIDIGMPKEPVFLLDQMFPGGILIDKEDLIAALIIFALLLMLFVLTFLPEFEEDRRRRQHAGDPASGGATEGAAAQTDDSDDDGL